MLIALPTPYAPLRRDKQKSYFFATPHFQLPTDDARVHNHSSAMRPLTSMLANIRMRIFVSIYLIILLAGFIVDQIFEWRDQSWGSISISILVYPPFTIAVGVICNIVYILNIENWNVNKKISWLIFLMAAPLIFLVSNYQSLRLMDISGC